MLVKDLMTPHVESISPQATLKEAAERMRDLDVGPLPVVNNEQLIGMLTDRDIVVRCVAVGDDPRTAIVKDAMSPDAITCFEDDTVENAAELMRLHLIRRLIVVDREGQLAGIVSLADLATQQPDEVLLADTVEEISEPISQSFFRDDSVSGEENALHEARIS